MPLTPLYAAMLAVLLIALSVRTIRERRRARVAIGCGGDKRLERAMRVQGNFTEYVPMTLLLMWLTESLWGQGAALLHLPGMLLLVGRLLHGYGVAQLDEPFKFRITGMALTFSAMALCVLAILARYLLAL